jgi:hypothetical protein
MLAVVVRARDEFKTSLKERKRLLSGRDKMNMKRL